MLASSATAQSSREYQNRADAALEVFLARFWDTEHHYLRQSVPGRNDGTGYWTYAQGFDALLDGAERSPRPEWTERIAQFYEGQDRRGWLVDFYDDETWMALALLRAHALTGESRYLDRARFLFSDIQKAWDTAPCGELRGGLWWDKKHSQKATASNAGPALLAVRLYQVTGSQSYLRFGRRAYRFWWRHMVNPPTYQVADHFDPAGAQTWWRFTYNEGLMIGAAVELYRATGRRSYLEEAHKIAGFVLKQETIETPYGRVLFDGSNAACRGDCHQFKGPAYRYLALLYRADPTHTEYRDVLKACADAIWNLARNPETGLFAVNWAGPPMSTATVAQDSAATMALNLFAALQNGATPGQPAKR